MRATLNGEEVRRNYSLCTAPDDDDWLVTVKRIGGGLFSNWVGDALKPGDTVDVMAPHGSFTTEFAAYEQAASRRDCRRVGNHARDVADPNPAQI